MCLRSGERCRLYQLIGRRCAVHPLQLHSPSPRSRKVLERQQSRGRVAEWLKAPDSKLFSPLWTDFLPLGQKCHFRSISLGFYNSHLDREGHRKTRFSTSSIQAEYTSGSIQVGGKQSDTGRLGFPVKIRLLCGAARRSTGHSHSAQSLPPLRCSACHQTCSCGGSIAIRPGGSHEMVPTTKTRESHRDRAALPMELNREPTAIPRKVPFKRTQRPLSCFKSARFGQKCLRGLIVRGLKV